MLKGLLAKVKSEATRLRVLLTKVEEEKTGLRGPLSEIERASFSKYPASEAAVEAVEAFRKGGDFHQELLDF